MKRKFPVLAISALLMTSVAFACGPTGTVRYEPIPYLSPQNDANRNFSLLLDTFHALPTTRVFVDSDIQKKRHEDAVTALIADSGRSGLALFEFQRLRNRFCPLNTEDKLEAIRLTFASRHLPERSHRCSGDCDLWSKKHDVRREAAALWRSIPEHCGPYTEQPLDIDLSLLKHHSIGSPFDEYTWLALGYYYAYAGDEGEADVYIDKIEGSALAGASQYSVQLKEVARRLAATDFPIPINTSFLRGYRVSWCFNDSRPAVLQFTESVLESAATNKEVAALVEARYLLMRAGCSEMEEDALARFAGLTQSDNSSPAAAEHAAYLVAAKSFYRKEYAAALIGFAELEGSTVPWIAEAALYMSGRIPLLQSQKNWNGVSSPVGIINQERLDAAERGYNNYLETYPQGRYADSTRGLARKIAHLRGDNKTLSDILDRVVDQAAETFIAAPNDTTRRDFNRVFVEWQRHPGGELDYLNASPLMIAYDVLRKLDEGEDPLAALRRAESRFVGVEKVYRLIRYLALEKNGDDEGIIAEPVPTNFADPIDVSIAAAHARASERAGLHTQARDTWIAIHESSEERKGWDSVQARIARTYILQNDYLGLASRSSHVSLIKVFEDAFATACDESALVEIAADKSLNPDASRIAREEIFRRRIVHADYDGLHALYQKLEEWGDYAAVQTAARMTSRDPENAKGLLNLGYYMMQNMSPHQSSLPMLDENTLARCPASYTTYMDPRDYFYRVVELHDDGSKSVDEAKALHYLVLCDKRGYWSRNCNWYGSSRPDQPSGKELFRRLYRKYPDSSWTENTPYYYD